MSQLLDIDVLDQTSHNMREQIAESLERLGTLVDGGTGRRAFDDHAGQALPARSFSWHARTRAECEALMSFLDARRGRLVPFWTPTYCWDLTLAAAVGASDTEIPVAPVGYMRSLFPLECRRRLAIVRPDGSFLLRKVLDVTDPGDGAEHLFLDAALGRPTAPGDVMLSFLALCRLEEDVVAVRWWTPSCAEADIPFRELPWEAPA